jgi:hypothetical protein
MIYRLLPLALLGAHLALIDISISDSIFWIVLLSFYFTIRDMLIKYSYQKQLILMTFIFQWAFPLAVLPHIPYNSPIEYFCWVFGILGFSYLRDNLIASAGKKEYDEMVEFVINSKK